MRLVVEKAEVRLALESTEECVNPVFELLGEAGALTCVYNSGDRRPLSEANMPGTARRCGSVSLCRATRRCN